MYKSHQLGTEEITVAFTAIEVFVLIAKIWQITFLPKIFQAGLCRGKLKVKHWLLNKHKQTNKQKFGASFVNWFTNLLRKFLKMF